VYAEFLYVEYYSAHLMLTNLQNQLYHYDKPKSNSEKLLLFGGDKSEFAKPIILNYKHTI